MEESDLITDSIPGLRFLPTEHQLIGYYLYNKIMGIPLSCNDLVKDFDIYGSSEPWEIWELFGGPNLERKSEGLEGDLDLYFFTRLKKVTPKGSNFVRKIGSGKWDGEDSGKEFYDEDHKCIGLMKRFHYENRNMPMHNGGWIMHQFSIDSSMLPSSSSSSSCPPPTDYVLCRIRKNTKGRKMSQKRRKLGRREEETVDSGGGGDSIGPNHVYNGGSGDASVQPNQLIIQQSLPEVQPEESYLDMVYNDGSGDESVGFGLDQSIIHRGLPVEQPDQLIQNTEESFVNMLQPDYLIYDDDDFIVKSLCTDQLAQESSIEGLLGPLPEKQENYMDQLLQELGLEVLLEPQLGMQETAAADSFSCLIEEREKQHNGKFMSGILNDAQSYIHSY